MTPSIVTTEQPRSTSDTPNSQFEIEQRVAAKRITWTGPLLVVAARSALLIAAQALLASIYLIKHHPSPWSAALPWWTVYATPVDLGCLLLIKKFTATEGIGIGVLIGRPRLRWGGDIFAGLGYFLLVFPLFLVMPTIGLRLLYGTTNVDMHPGLLIARSLPLWAVVYSLSVWWIVWSPTEQTTYQAYALPRILALSGRRWIAVGIVSFWWALQHSFLPFIPDWKYVLWRFIAFLPGVTVFTLIYLRTRRLPPLIVAHWPMDIAAALITLKL